MFPSEEKVMENISENLFPKSVPEIISYLDMNLTKIRFRELI